MLSTPSHPFAYVPAIVSELEQYNYELPRELIAQEPLPNRADARLLVVDRAADSLAHHHVRDLPDLLSPRDCLVLNDTQVVPARLVGTRAQTGGRWEGLFLSADDGGFWKLLGKTRGKVAPGETIVLLNERMQEELRLALVERLDDGGWLALPDSDEPAPEILERVGRVPLPHYIRGGEMIDSDRERYQTVYARHPGAVAAPTAGLHFTPELLRTLDKRGIRQVFVTLHVALDTFRPITSPELSGHRMHREWGSIDAQAAAAVNERRAAGGRAVAVGTTSVRVLESAAAADGRLKAWSDTTDLFIRPGFSFRAVDALLTNFHLPRTTLLVLVRTFGGDGLIQRAYAEAIAQQYRFFSYGDAMLIL